MLFNEHFIYIPEGGFITPEQIQDIRNQMASQKVELTYHILNYEIMKEVVKELSKGPVHTLSIRVGSCTPLVQWCFLVQLKALDKLSQVRLEFPNFTYACSESTTFCMDQVLGCFEKQHPKLMEYIHITRATPAYPQILNAFERLRVGISNMFSPPKLEEPKSSANHFKTD